MKLKSGAHVHFIGICGTAMASLAGLLKEQGYKITGSDQNVYPPMSTQLEDLSIEIMQGYKKENLERRPDLVIVGNVISKTNPEAAALLASDIPYTSLPKAMGEFVIGDKHSIVISGTHGKTTTTSMMLKVASEVGVKPSYMVGGIPMDYGRSFAITDGHHFIIEGDEYDTAFFDKVPKFVHYKPRFVILTGIEFDHADIYKDLDDVLKAFRILVEKISADGLLVVNGQCPNTQTLLHLAKCKVVTYGVDSLGGKDLDYKIVDREIIDGRNHFAVNKKGERIADIAIRLPGEHNAMNALGAYVLATELGWSNQKALQGLANFSGVKRRQEIIGTPSGVTLIEDFAHHPSAVKATSEAIKEKYFFKNSSAGRLICLFEPRSATSRRKIFQKDYVDAFSSADFVFIAQAYDQSKISEEDRFSTAELVSDLKRKGIAAVECPNVDSIVKQVKATVRSGDVVLIMSNGSFDGIYKKL